ncbi:MAG: UDP-2-acetamido-2,6-beta-L-arabino-hexul-4-ose reductase [Syntrophomonadaceae bacterium]|nr:UDP-2-acetamido-2,6-beta-L-arabino-hexul-4-ose reductase [Bacillota bacterium]
MRSKKDIYHHEAHEEHEDEKGIIMNKVLVTGSNGFIGKNLVVRLKRCEDVEIMTFDIEDELSILVKYLKSADVVFHLAGVNRPEKVEEFETGNAGLTRTIVNILEKSERNVSVVLSSSIQATLDNPYGISKKQAEDMLLEYSEKNNAKIYIYRFPNVFGKWCRPNYNSVVATFCCNIGHGLDISISDVNKEIELVYIDDVIDEFLSVVSQKSGDKNKYYYKVKRTFRITLGELAEKIYQLRGMRKSLVVPDLSDDFMKCLHATYLSYLDKDDFSYKLDLKTDQRGSLAELIKSEHFGQIFVSTTHKGVIRGNHYHNTKIEKFCVLKGEAVIRFRHILEDEVLSYYVSGDNLEVVDIPPGHTHSIENLGDSEIVVLFWANQIFNPEEPDTYHCEV